MKPGEAGHGTSAEGLLRVLERRTALGGLTPGQLRAELAKAGGRWELEEVRGLCHDLWLKDEVVIEPPGRGKREWRVWHAAHRRAAGRGARERAAPAGRATREGADGGAESFRATMCGQLAGEWMRAKPGETREVLRRLLMNFGAERVGVLQEVVPFQGRRHHCEGVVMPGQAVRVAEPGWALRQGMGEYLLAKAAVVAVRGEK